MRILGSGAESHKDQEVTTFAVCWRVERSDGVTILGTEHDRDLTIETAGFAGTYMANAGITGSNVASSSDMSVDNMEVKGAINRGDLQIVDLSSADIEAGLFDDAAFIMFLANWSRLTDLPIVLRSGNIGEITRTEEGEYTTELRGLTQRLTRQLLKTYGSSCDAELGDSRCTVNIFALTETGTVTAVHSNRAFSVSVTSSSATEEDFFFNGGVLTFTSGANDGYGMEVKSCLLDVTINEVLLYLPMTSDVQVGDTFSIRPGCDKTAALCKNRFNNLVNYRGHGTWCPGATQLAVFGGQTPPTPPDDVSAFLDHVHPINPFIA